MCFHLLYFFDTFNDYPESGDSHNVWTAIGKSRDSVLTLHDLADLLWKI